MANLLFVLPDLHGVGGMQKINKKLALALNNSGVDSNFFGFEKFGSGCFFKRLVLCLKNAAHFFLALNGRNFVCILNISGFEIILFTLICVFRKIEFIYWEHGDPVSLGGNFSVKILRRFFYKKAKAIVVIHSSYVSMVGENLVNVVYVPNISPQLSSPFVARKGGVRSVVWVGRLGIEKNHNLAFDAFLEAAIKMPGINFNFIYPFHELPSLNLIQVPKNFYFIDGVDFNYKSFFSENSLHVLTSKTEAMPGVLLESVSCLSRFISTNCSPWVSDLALPMHGLVVPVEISHLDLSDAIVKIINSCVFDLNFFEINSFLKKCSEEVVVEKWKTLIFG